jgi:hypothetical protein
VATAQTYQPLETGLRWIYGPASSALRDTVVVIGPTVFDGVNAVELRYQGFNRGLSQFWSTGVDGAALFHGYQHAVTHVGIHYTPPIRMIVRPVVAAHAWQDVVDFHCTLSHGPCETDTTGMIVDTEVLGVGSKSLPAGLYVVATVSQDASFSAAAVIADPEPVAVMGMRRLEDGAIVAGVRTDWWVENVGRVREYDDWYLLGFDLATPARSVSWGRLKLFYR